MDKQSASSELLQEAKAVPTPWHRTVYEDNGRRPHLCCGQHSSLQELKNTTEEKLEAFEELENNPMMKSDMVYPKLDIRIQIGQTPCE